MPIPTLEAVAALDGRIFAMLSDEERAIFDFYRAQGRKYEVAVTIISAAGSDELARASSFQEENAILKSINSRIAVTIGPGAQSAIDARALLVDEIKAQAAKTYAQFEQEQKKQSRTEQLVNKARQASQGDFDVLSDREKLGAALVLNRADWLDSMNVTLPQAIDRLGPNWLTVIPKAAHVIEDEGL